jgi:hypothetical protein
VQKTIILCETGDNGRWMCVGDSRDAAEREYKEMIEFHRMPRPLYRVIIRTKR